MTPRKANRREGPLMQLAAKVGKITWPAPAHGESPPVRVAGLVTGRTYVFQAFLDMLKVSAYVDLRRTS